MFVTADVALISLGLLEPLLGSLAAAGFDAAVGPGVTGEPSPEAVESLVAVAAEAPNEAIVGFGGGSAIDASKLVAASLNNEIPLRTGLGPTAALAPVPILSAVPTTAGTGAETTAVAMLWHERRKRIFVHDRLVPRHAVLDPDLLAALPRPIVAASGLDAMSHAIESTLSTFRTPLSLSAGRLALARLAGALHSEYQSTDPRTRAEMSLGAFEAGLSLNASVVIGHSLAYTIAARTGLSHGVTSAMALPYCLAYCRAAAEPQMGEMAQIVGIEPVPERFVHWIAELVQSIGIPPSLDAVGISSGDLRAMATECCSDYPRPNNPVPFSIERIQRLLESFHAGDITRAWADFDARAVV